MLDGILGRGFSARCKSLTKQTKSRIYVITRKRNATLRFLKKDVADLLANGLDINAYGRAEGLLSELALSSCYDFVEQSCDFVLKHLSVMQKVRHCPEDCRETVSSLMFAAARFSDLPELRELRQTFYDRYGNSLELFVNQEFIENLSPEPFAMEKKLKLMQDIAAEYSIIWDSGAFEQRMSRPLASVQHQQKSHGSLHANEDVCKSKNGRDSNPNAANLVFSSKGRLEHTNEGHKFINEKENKVSQRNEISPRYRDEVSNNRHQPITFTDETFLKSNSHAAMSQFSRETTAEKYEPWTEDNPPKAIRLGSSSHRERNAVDGRRNRSLKRDDQDNLIHGKPDFLRYAGMQSKDDKQFLAHNSYGSKHDVVVPRTDVQKEEVHNLKPLYNNGIPPPYTKSNSKPKDCGASLGSPPNDFGGSAIPNSFSRDNHISAGDCPHKSHQAGHHPENADLKFGVTRANGHTVEYYRDKNPVPKPRCSRRRHSKSQASHSDVGHADDKGDAKRRSRSRRRECSRQGLQVLFDDEHYKNDEEERIIDRLLMHYSKKPSACEPGRGRKPRSRHSRHQGTEVGESPQNAFIEGGPSGIAEAAAAPRSISLPHEQTAPPELKLFTRAASFQPDRSSPARHVHPKLPDYDDLAAQFAALKGR